VASAHSDFFQGKADRGLFYWLDYSGKLGCLSKKKKKTALITQQKSSILILIFLMGLKMYANARMLLGFILKLFKQKKEIKFKIIFKINH
jgi:hypothetical protein